METPWIELAQAQPAADFERAAPLDRNTPYAWQALFACQVVPRPFEEREKLKWGFNLQTLLDEARDRQRLFLEALHTVDLRAQRESPAKNTLALRVVNSPALDGLLFGLVGKVFGQTQESARREACDFARSVAAIVPHDYILVPAVSRVQFHLLAGREILSACRSPDALVNLRRLEMRMHAAGEPFYLLGNWQAPQLSEEITWRALAGLDRPGLLNICLRPTIQSELEVRALATLLNGARKIQEQNAAGPYAAYLDWAIEVLENRSAELVRPYLLQVHFAVPGGVPGYLPRVTGASITRPPKDGGRLGAYESFSPQTPAEVAAWASYMYWADFLPVNPLDQVFSHIKDLADLEEAHAVFRLPYPNAAGLPGLQILDGEALRVLEGIRNLNEGPVNEVGTDTLR